MFSIVIYATQVSKLEMETFSRFLSLFHSNIEPSLNTITF